MLVQLTDAGAALLTANRGPIQLANAKLGSQFSYVPDPTKNDIKGSLVYQSAPSLYTPISGNVVKYSVYLDYDLGPFQFGEFALFTSDGTCFAIGANDVLINKQPISAGVFVGNSIRLDIYLSMVGTNYQMWLDYAESSNQFRMAVLGSVDSLPSAKDATPNAYIITSKSAQQAAFLAYTDRSGLWNFDAYAYANQAEATIIGFDSQSVTIALADYLPGMSPPYAGAVIAEFSSGALFGICRYVSSVVVNSNNVVLGFDNPLMLNPQLDDKIVFFARQSLSTTIPNLPIATASSLGAVIVGPTLTVNAQGVLNVAATSYPVTSVNGQTGEVVLTADDITGLATVAKTGNYNDLTNKPTQYTLPIANQATLGGVKAPAGTNHLVIAGDGTIDIAFQPVLTVNGNSPDPSTGDVTVTFNPIGLVKPTQVANGTDFNSLQTTGLFFALDADAASFLNAPNTSAGGTLDIEPFTTTAGGGDVIQRYTQASIISVRRYTKSSNTWSAWATLTAASAQPFATTTSPGVVQVGAGLNVTGGGILSTQIQSINGKSDQFTVLSASDVGAVATTAVGAQNGVAALDTGSVTPATDPYTFGRLLFVENTLGTWFNAGKWDANANHLVQIKAASGTPDTSTALVAGGQHTIDISYNGVGVAGLTNPDYQTVSAEGMVYEVTVAGTTALDGISSWAVGDLAVCVNGLWRKLPKTAYTLPIATSSVLGGVKKGTGLDVAGDGTLSVTGVSNNAFANPGYRHNADGSIEMWGTVSFPIGTNQVDVTLPITVPNGFLSLSMLDGGSTCIPYGGELLNSTTLRLWAPAYIIDQGTGNVIARPLIASGFWRLLVN